MTAITEISAGHFSGAKAITGERAGEDTRSLEDLIRELQTAVNSGGIVPVTDDQRTAATETRTAFIAPADGEIIGCAAYPQAGAAAGESETVDIQIGGVSALTAVITLDDTTGTNLVVGALNPAAVAFAQGDIVTIVRTYVAGGAPTPMTGIAATVAARFAE